MNIKEILTYILAIPKSTITCLRLFPAKEAIRLPVIISPFCKVRKLHKGAVQIKEGMFQTGILRFGFGGTTGVQPFTNKSFFEIEKNGTLYLNGKVSFGRGSTIRVGGQLFFGEACHFNTHTFISCNNRIEIGDRFRGGWCLNIQDTRNHALYYDGALQEDKNSVRIGNDVWFAAHTDMLNGEVGDGSVVAYGALVTKKFTEPNILIGGVPAKKIKENVKWGDFDV